MMELSVSVPLLVSFCGLIVTAINVISKVHEVHKQTTENPLVGVLRELGEHCVNSEDEAVEECVGNDYSRDIEVHIIVNNNASVRYISAVDFDPDRFIEWADLHEHGLFNYDLIKSYTMRSDMTTVECWKLYMWFKVESDLCQQEIQGLLPF